ncbi:hypothetical protein B4083_5411 [Bacillus cereus]|nr:hypothetical protein B4083_5411 [Bacillus cereus]
MYKNEFWNNGNCIKMGIGSVREWYRIFWNAILFIIIQFG